MNKDVIGGVLLGTAIGDALGLPCEGMSARAIRRRFGRVERYHLIGGRGFVSDDTEQTALLAQALAASEDLDHCRRLFRRSMLGWFLRLPWGIGLGTLRACLRIGLGFRVSGVRSAGNGAAMRSGILGVVLAENRERRLAYGKAIAEVTHTDPRAVEAALFVAELARASARANDPRSTVNAREALAREAMSVVTEPDLRQRLSRAGSLAMAESPVEDAGEELGTSGFVLQSLPFALFCFLRFGDEPKRALVECVSAGGDADTNAAIVGGWLGALHGVEGLPSTLVGDLWDGVFGPSHLRALAAALAKGGPPPGFSALRAMARNLLLYPVVLGHGFRRLLPW